MLKFTENIQPDSLSGAIFAIEGIRDACVILNGPTGCKFYHSAVSDSQYMRGLPFDASVYSESHYMGQMRVPSTYLDGQDYVFGSGEKLSPILNKISGQGFGLIAVINSPGAALIGDDLESFLDRQVKGVPCFSIENTGYSGNFSEGYQKAVIKALGCIKMKTRREPDIQRRSVNLLGFNVYQKYFRENYEALKSLLACCGVSVTCAPGAGDCTGSLGRMTEAGFNVIVYPEYGNHIARHMEGAYGVPYVPLEDGPPIGFDGTESFVRRICHEAGADQAPALDKINEARAKAYLHLTRFSSLLGLPKGSVFGVRAEASVCHALTKWLCSYLGMIPGAVSVMPDGDEASMKGLTDFLAEINCTGALEGCITKTPLHILFADGNTIAKMRLQGKKVCGVELSLPGFGWLDVTEKHILGERGALFVIEQILNGLRFLL